MKIQKQAEQWGTPSPYRWGNGRVVHFGVEDDHGNILPACGTHMGRYALPFHSGPEVTCKKCQEL